MVVHAVHTARHTDGLSMSADTRELREMSRRFGKAAKAPVAVDMADMLAHIMVAEAKRVMGHDTNQLDRRTTVTSVTGTASSAVATVEADTPYAGHHNYGNPWTGPNLFWDRGIGAAERAVEEVGGEMVVSVERMLTSGGVWNPRRVT